MEEEQYFGHIERPKRVQHYKNLRTWLQNVEAIIDEHQSDEVSDQRQEELELEIKLLIDGDIGKCLFFLGYDNDYVEAELLKEPAMILTMLALRGLMQHILTTRGVLEQEA